MHVLYCLLYINPLFGLQCCYSVFLLLLRIVFMILIPS